MTIAVLVVLVARHVIVCEMVLNPKQSNGFCLRPFAFCFPIQRGFGGPIQTVPSVSEDFCRLSRCWKLIIGFDHVIFDVLRLLPLNFFFIGFRDQLRYRYWPHHRVDCNKEKITFTDFFLFPSCFIYR